jgi:hypothetical protein
MPPDRPTDSPEAVLRVLLRSLAAAVIVIAMAVMWTMGEGSASQGGRFYVAVIAIVVLGAINAQQTRLLRRRLPFAVGTLPEERRHARASLLMLLLVSGLLLGFALSLSGGTSSALLRLGGYVLGLAMLFLLVPSVAERLLKGPFERGIDALFGGSGSGTPRTFTFSFGTRPARAVRSALAQAPGAASLPQERRSWYRDAWQAINVRVADDPAQAVRDAHALVLTLCAETGHPGVVPGTEQAMTWEPGGAPPSFSSIAERLGDARAVRDAVRAALAHEPASPSDLRMAMAEYERIVAHLLGE